MQPFIQKRFNAFSYAFQGLWYVLKTQPNAWIHSAATLVVIVLAAWLKLNTQDWAILVLTMCVVWMTEIMNTAIEALTDLASPQHHPLAKIAKDVSAACVLFGALGAVVVGLLILGPPLWKEIWFVGR